MNNPTSINKPGEIINQIHVSVSHGNLNEAYDLIERLEVDAAYPSSPIDEMKLTLLKGVVMLKRGDYKAAEDSLLRSLDLANNFGDTQLRCNRYDNLVALYTTTNQVHNAIGYLKKSMELKESEGDQAAQARSLLQMSSLLFIIEDNEGGEVALNKANEIISKLDNMEMKMQYYFANAMLHVREKKYKEALAQYEQISAYAQEANDIFLASRTYFNQGDLLMDMKEMTEAEFVFTRLLKLTVDNHLISQELIATTRLASIALEKGDPIRCRELYDYVTNHSDLGQDDALQEELAELGARLYEAEGNPQKALEAYRSYMQSYKQHYDNEQSKIILFIKARYENEKKERELKEARLSQVESEMKALIAEQALRETEKRFKAWVENGTDMIVILTADLSPTYTSPFIYKTMGYKKGDFKNISPYDFIHQDDIRNVQDALKISQDCPGIAVSAQFRFLQKDGQYRWIEGTSTNLLDDETVNGIVCNLKDITERKQSEEAIQELNRSLEVKITERTSELQDAIKDLEAFSYSVSHDLRSPLRIIMGYAKLLISDHEQSLNDEAREFVLTIIDNSKRMGQLIDDLLNFSRMGRKAVYRSDANINTMVTGIISDFRKGDDTITKNIIIHELAPCYCDVALIKQVWINLISNAIKYSGKKTNPMIEIGSIARFNETVYYIKDNGAGFDMRFAKNLFTVFKRLHDRSDFDGMGVGLALAHRIIRMHEGRIWAEAEVEKGATFYFTLGPGE
jgi:PAS domain S-box-containing protein